MTRPSRVHSATEEEIQQLFGSNRLLIGFPVRPPSSGRKKTPGGTVV